jgi:hypothetical protein
MMKLSTTGTVRARQQSPHARLFATPLTQLLARQALLDEELEQVLAALLGAAGRALLARLDALVDGGVAEALQAADAVAHLAALRVPRQVLEHALERVDEAVVHDALRRVERDGELDALLERRRVRGQAVDVRREGHRGERVEREAEEEVLQLDAAAARRQRAKQLVELAEVVVHRRLDVRVEVGDAEDVAGHLALALPHVAVGWRQTRRQRCGLRDSARRDAPTKMPCRPSTSPMALRKSEPLTCVPRQHWPPQRTALRARHTCPAHSRSSQSWSAPRQHHCRSSCLTQLTWSSARAQCTAGG